MLLYIPLFPNITSLNLKPELFGVYHLGSPLQGSEDSISAIQQLSELSVTISWGWDSQISSYSPAEISERRRIIEDALRDSISTIIQMRSDNECLPRTKLKGKLFVQSKDSEFSRQDPARNGLVWSSDSPDVECPQNTSEAS